MSHLEAITLREKFKKLVPWIEDDIMFCLADVAQKEIDKWKHNWNEEAVKIENALEIIAKLETMRFTTDKILLIKELKDALLFPRKEEDKK